MKWKDSNAEGYRARISGTRATVQAPFTGFSLSLFRPYTSAQKDAY